MFIILLVKMEKSKVIHNRKTFHKISFFILIFFNRFSTGYGAVINKRAEVKNPSDKMARTGKYTL